MLGILRDIKSNQKSASGGKKKNQLKKGELPWSQEKGASVKHSPVWGGGCKGRQCRGRVDERENSPGRRNNRKRLGQCLLIFPDPVCQERKKTSAKKKHTASAQPSNRRAKKREREKSRATLRRERKRKDKREGSGEEREKMFPMPSCAQQVFDNGGRAQGKRSVPQGGGFSKKKIGWGGVLRQPQNTAKRAISSQATTEDKKSPQCFRRGVEKEKRGIGSPIRWCCDRFSWGKQKTPYIKGELGPNP